MKFGSPDSNRAPRRVSGTISASIPAAARMADGVSPSRGSRRTGSVSSTAPKASDIFEKAMMIRSPRRPDEYPDREIDCQEAMEPGFQAIVDCMLEAGWTRGEIMRSLRRLIAADNLTQKENAKVETQLAIARAMIRAGRLL
jgi:hypothetical protein